MSKSIKLKCASSEVNSFFRENNLYKGRIKKDGSIQVKDGYGVWFDLPKNLVLIGSIQTGNDEIEARVSFVELKTKTIKCMSVNHGNGLKKSFKPGKRYQMESGRALGAVAGYVFDDDGCRWTLMRQEVGFSVADGTLFEARYS